MRRRKKTEDCDDPKFFTRKGERRTAVMNRLETASRAREHLKGRVVTKPWRKKGNGEFVDMPDLVPPPLLRADVRFGAYGDGSRKVRRRTDGSTDRPFTKPAAGTVRNKRRARNAQAKRSRKANR